MKAISKKQPLINSSQRLKSLYLLQGNFIINSSAKNFYDDVSFEKRKKSLETLEALNNRYSDYMNKIHKYMDVINFNNSNNIRKRYFNSYYSKYGQDIDEKLNFKGEPQLVVPDSVLYNKDKHKLPKLYTTNPPESEESFKSKFKANTNIQTGFKPNPDKIDSYYIIGTEIFKNLRKEHIKNKEFDQPEFDYYVNAINNNIDIKELRTDKTEEFFPLKDDLEVSPIEEESKYIHPNLYFEVEEKNKHLFGPDLENGKEYINPYLTTKKDYYMGCRKKHNSRLFQLLSQVSTIFNRNWDQYTNFNPKLLEIINTLSQMKSNTSDFTFSNDEFTRAVETGDFHEIKSLFTPEEILLIKHNLTEMKGLVSNISLNEISDFVMSMFFIANINFKSLWVILEEKILNGIHHLKHTDLCKLLMVSSMSSPKYFTKRLRDNLIAEMIKDKSPSVLIETLIATRFKQDAKLFDSLSEYAIKNHKNWVLKELSAKRKAENLVVPLLFALSFGKPPRPKVEFKYEVQVDFDEKFSDFSDTIIELTPLFSKEQTLLTLNSLALTGIDEVELLVYQLQKNLMGLKLNPKEIAWVCESLNQMRKGKMSGTEELVLHLLNWSLMNFSKFCI